MFCKRQFKREQMLQIKVKLEIKLIFITNFNDGSCPMVSSHGRNFQYTIYLIMFILKNQLLYKQTFYEINPPEEGFKPLPTCSTSNSLSTQSQTNLSHPQAIQVSAPKLRQWYSIRAIFQILY